MTRSALVSPDRFVGLDGICHLCTGGESPWLKSHAEVYERFAALKSAGNRGREEVLDAVESTRRGVADLWGVDAQNVSFLSSSSEAMNNLARGIDWKPGDNIVTTALEFPSVAWAWRDLHARGVDVRAVPHTDWVVSEQTLLDAVDENTRLLVVSQVSYYTGQHLDIEHLARSIDRSRTLIAVDATHASGVLPVPADVTDLTVSSSYKWMLGTTGTASCYVSPNAMEQIKVSSYGWHNMHYGPPPNPVRTELVDMPHLLEPGNPALLNILMLGNAVRVLHETGPDAIADHARALAGEMNVRLRDAGLDVISAPEPERRSGNTCVTHADSDRLCDALDSADVLVWGDRGRIRFSTHLYNSSADVERAAGALVELIEK